MYDWTIDYITLGVYLIGVTVIGTLTARRVSSASTFFMGERRFGKWMMTMFTFGTGTSTDQAVTTVAKTYTVGASGIWYQWLWIFATPVYWLLAPLFRRMRAVTTADYLHARYDRSVAVLFAIVGILGLAVLIGVMLKACGAMVTAVTGGAISEGVAIYGMTILFVIYGVAGGLTAAVITDFIQGILTVALSFLILPFALQAVGGLDGLRVMIDDPSFFELISDAPGTERLGLFYVIMIFLNGLIGWVTTPHSMQMCGAGRTDQEARVGLVGGMLLKRFCTMAWVLTALCGVGMYMSTPLHEDLVWGTMARDLLPGIAPGLVGLFIASVLAAVMSSCDAFMVCSAALFTENIYRPLIRPDRSEKHYVLVGRLTSIAVVAGGILLAFELPSVVDGLELVWIVQAMMGVSMWFSFFWRRATAAAAWASTLAGFATWFLTSTVQVAGVTLWDFNGRFGHLLPESMMIDGVLSLPWQMLIYLSVAAVVMVVVSLFTAPPSEARLDSIYATLRTPVATDEPEVAPLTLPEGVEPAPRDPLIDLSGFEVMKPSVSGVVGFLVCSGLVAGLIWFFAWIIG